MSGADAELDQIRHGVSCAVLLERLGPAWQFDRKGSTRRALKYRRGEGEIVIVNHEGRGWWDPHSQAKGDVFDLVQFLDPGLNFGQVRQTLRPFVGLSPRFPDALRERRRARDDRPPSVRWASRPSLRAGSPAWRYLAEERHLPVATLTVAAAGDAVRDGAYGSAWFAHRDEAGLVTHVEIRGPDFKGSLRDGTKTLFRLWCGADRPRRLALAEAPIDALSLAAIEGVRDDTIYAATGGGIGPATASAIERLLANLSGSSDALLSIATDANTAGDRYAARHAEMATAAGVPFERLRPPEGLDWNDMLKQGRRG